MAGDYVMSFDVRPFHNVFRKALTDNNIQFTEKQIRGGARYYNFA